MGAGNQFVHIGNALRDAVESRGWKRIGFEGNFENIAPAWNAAELYIPARRTHALFTEVFGEDNLVDATELICVQRACKTPYEIQKLQIVNEISCVALATFRNSVLPGVTGVELAAAVEASVMKEGTGYRDARRVRAFAQVAVGSAETSIAYRPMEISTTRRLENGDIALLELAVVADGFWSDRTRAYVAGIPTAQQIEINDILKIAQDEAIEAVKPGSTGGNVDRAARQVIEDAGHVKHFVHITGHGVGFGYHEPLPLIAPECSDVLQEGMVHSVEPGIYFPELGGMRIEDDVLVTENGCEILGQFGRDLEQ
jgi:Xaa-Pro aminopeptidase